MAKRRVRRGGPARLACAGRRGGGHPIVPEVVAAARALLEGSALSFKAIAARTGVSTTSLCRWCRREGCVRAVPPPPDRIRLPRYRRGRGRPYATDAVSRVRDLLTRSLLSQKEIARRTGVSQERVSAWMRQRGWTRPVPSSAKRFAAAGRTGRVAVAGDRRGRPYAAEVRAEARVLWEDTRLSTALIGARLGIHPATLARWSHEEAWLRPPGRLGARQLRGFFGSRARPRPARSGEPRIRRL